MALLRNFVKLWARSMRPFSTEMRPSADLTSGLQSNGRMTPRLMRLQSNLPLNDRLRANEQITPEGWVNIRKEILASTEFDITESTVDMTIVHLCLDNEKTEKAMEYLEYLWDGDYEMNLSPMISYLKLCYTKGPNEKQTEYLLKMYNRIREKYPVMDALSAETCIMAISLTNKWKDCFELVDMVLLSSKPRSVTYSAIIIAAWKNNEPEIGWKYLRECRNRLNPEHNAYIEYLYYCKRNFTGTKLQEEISKIFEFWGDQDVRPYVGVISEYEKVLEEIGWRAVRTSIKQLYLCLNSFHKSILDAFSISLDGLFETLAFNLKYSIMVCAITAMKNWQIIFEGMKHVFQQYEGVCLNCSHKLSSLHITPLQYKQLTDAVRERVIIGDDLYRKTTPQEFKKFLRFMDRVKPYDIVIDGLNVSYISKSRTKPDGSQLTNVIKTCVKMGKTVMVLGRKHMFRWPKLDMGYITAHGSFFLAENISDDDPFLLYATLIRGPNTQFVSKDLMRQHKFLIDDVKLQKIFKYWLMAHQLYPFNISSNRESQVALRKPPDYLPLAQKDDNGWHVPFSLDSSLQPPLVYEPPKSWVCFRKNPSL